MKKEDFLKLVNVAQKKSASDIHLVAGFLPYLRINGLLSPVKLPVLSVEGMEELSRRLLTHDQLTILDEKGDLDFGLVEGKSVMRINAHKQLTGLGMAIRLIPERIPSPETLLLEPIFFESIKERSGLIIISGPAGAGKSTMLASLVQELNRTERLHIITLEDPIEYRFPKGKSLIEQRQLHTDFDLFQNGLRHALRQDPNIIVVGEMRDPETIELALTAAETGHLVIATLHAPNTAEAIERIVNVFEGPKQQQILVQLSASIKLIVTQILLPTRDGQRIAARELLIGTSGIKNAIRQNNLSSIRSSVSTGKKYGMQSLEQAVSELEKQELI